MERLEHLIVQLIERSDRHMATFAEDLKALTDVAAAIHQRQTDMEAKVDAAVAAFEAFPQRLVDAVNAAKSSGELSPDQLAPLEAIVDQLRTDAGASGDTAAKLDAATTASAAVPAQPPDSPPDSPPDVPPDVPPDAPPDSPPDAPPDTPPDQPQAESVPPGQPGV